MNERKVTRANASPEDHFWSRVAKGRDEDCWPWTGAVAHQSRGSRGGYGAAKYRGRNWIAHRLAYELANGEPAGALFVCHHCDNPPCCNPAHLFLGTAADNVRDMHSKGRGSSACGSRIAAAKLTEAQVRLIRSLYVRGDPDRNGPALAVEFGVDRSTITRILDGKAWLHDQANLPKGAP